MSGLPQDIPGNVRPDWIAVDWGTSNLRIYAMSRAQGVLEVRNSDKGMGSLTRDAFEPVLRSLLNGWDLPAPCTVLCCGMVGARQGWHEAPYREVPCTAALDAPVHVPTQEDDLTVYILPGLRQSSPADVMRGEETQIAGFLALNPGWDGVLCLPGTHSKWAELSAGEVVSFRTSMTGELFSVIAGQTVLRHSIARTGWDAMAFETALADARSKPEMLATRLFSLRAQDLLQGQSPETARATLSGLLIGAELAAMRPYWLGQRVALIGAGTLTDIYAKALELQGVPSERASAAETTLAGLSATYAALTQLPIQKKA